MSHVIIRTFAAAVTGGGLIAGIGAANAAMGEFDGVWKGKTSCEHISIIDLYIKKKVVLTVKGATASFKTLGKKGRKAFPASGKMEYEGNNAEVTIYGESESGRAENSQYKIVAAFTKGSDEAKITGEIGKFNCSFKIARKSTGGSSASA
ncbi:MAG: hypothetical protein WD407_04130, partial [Rhodospirillales bacterium]